VRQLAELFVHERGGLFENAERANHLARHAVVADVEVMKRALSLRSPVAVGGHLDAPIESVSILVFREAIKRREADRYRQTTRSASRGEEEN
jgi:hypothetical protein